MLVKRSKIVRHEMANLVFIGINRKVLANFEQENSRENQ